jgi:hypothetical protein
MGLTQWGDAVEVNPSHHWPHISQFYRDGYFGRVEELCDSLPTYDDGGRDRAH